MGMRALRLDLWLPPLLLMGVIFFVSDQPSLNSGLGAIDLIGRKLIHFAEYALLTFLWWRALVTVMSPAEPRCSPSFWPRLRRHRRVPPDVRGGSPRHPVDWAIDSAGAALMALKLRTVRVRDRLVA